MNSTSQTCRPSDAARAIQTSAKVILHGGRYAAALGDFAAAGPASAPPLLASTSAKAEDICFQLALSKLTNAWHAHENTTADDKPSPLGWQELRGVGAWLPQPYQSASHSTFYPIG